MNKHFVNIGVTNKDPYTSQLCGIMKTHHIVLVEYLKSMCIKSRISSYLLHKCNKYDLNKHLFHKVK